MSYLTIKVALYSIIIATPRTKAVSLGVRTPIVLEPYSGNSPRTNIVGTKIQVRAVRRGEIRTPSIASSFRLQFPICNNVIAATADDLDTTACCR